MPNGTESHSVKVQYSYSNACCVILMFMAEAHVSLYITAL